MGRHEPPELVFGLRDILFFAAAVAAICLIAALVTFAYLESQRPLPVGAAAMTAALEAHKTKPGDG